MEVYATEDQQLEAIRKWFKENGKSIFWAIIVVVTLVLGYRYWQHHTKVVTEKASEYYTAMMLSESQEDMQTAKAKANTLIAEYDNTPYASLAALFLAKISVQEKALEAAEEKLQWVIGHSKINEFKWVSKIRLARIYLAQEKHEKALALIDHEEPNGYLTLTEELKGDIFVAQNKFDLARLAYETAFKTVSNDHIDRSLLKMKLEELGSPLVSE